MKFIQKLKDKFNTFSLQTSNVKAAQELVTDTGVFIRTDKKSSKEIDALDDLKAAYKFYEDDRKDLAMIALSRGITPMDMVAGRDKEILEKRVLAFNKKYNTFL